MSYLKSTPPKKSKWKGPVSYNWVLDCSVGISPRRVRPLVKKHKAKVNRLASIKSIGYCVMTSLVYSRDHEEMFRFRLIASRFVWSSVLVAISRAAISAFVVIVVVGSRLRVIGTVTQASGTTSGVMGLFLGLSPGPIVPSPLCIFCITVVIIFVVVDV